MYPVKCGYPWREAVSPYGCSLQGQRHSQTQPGPRQRQLQSGWTKAREQTGESSLVIDLTPHLLPFHGFNSPIVHKGVANGSVGDPSSPPPPSHTHSPCFLKSPRSAGRWRPRNTTMRAGTTRTVPMPTSPKHQARRLHHNPALRDAVRPPSSRAPAPGRGEEGLFSKSSSHLLHWSRPSTDPAPQTECRGGNTLTDRETEAWSLRVPGFSGQYD